MAQEGKGSQAQAVVWRPNEGPQTFAMTCPFEEILYGGARGGGKSDFILARFLTQAALFKADASGIIFRRSLSEFDELIKRSKVIYGAAGGRWNETKKRWTFPGGAVMKFAYLERDVDASRYQGHSYTYVGVDEAQTWADSDTIAKLKATLRSAHGVPTIFVLTANPLGVGHEWIFDRYIKNSEPYEPQEESLDNGRKIRRAFIPALLEDNPHLLKDPLYELRLKQATLGKPWLWNAWRHGDWNAKPPSAWFDFDKAEVLPERPRDVLRWVRFWDFAATKEAKGKDPDFTAGALLGIRPSGKYVWADLVMIRETPAVIEKIVRNTALIDGRAVSVKIEQEPGSAGIHLIDHYVRRVLPGWDIEGFKTTGAKELYISPFHSQWQVGNVDLVDGAWIQKAKPQVVAFPSPGVHDDSLDAVSKALHFLAVPEPSVYVG